MGRWLKALRQVPVVQTIASRPRDFAGIEGLVFGDVVVAQSRDTRDRLVSGWVADPSRSARQPRVEVILPPLGEVRIPTLDETTSVRRELGLGPDVPILLYPGDLEVSHAARLVKAASVVIAQRHPTATVVFAYRDKTPHAVQVASDLLRELNPQRVRLVREASDILALVRTSAAVLFPVDDLYGKIDIPIILLQAMALSTPVVTYNQGPLADLAGVEVVRTGDPFALADAGLALIDAHDRRGQCIDAQLQAVRTKHDAARVAAAYEQLYDELLVGERGATMGG
jgi:glycosyltransferase involved in cell wall biosynthesis